MTYHLIERHGRSVLFGTLDFLSDWDTRSPAFWGYKSYLGVMLHTFHGLAHFIWAFWGYKSYLGVVLHTLLYIQYFFGHLMINICFGF